MARFITGGSAPRRTSIGVFFFYARSFGLALKSTPKLRVRSAMHQRIGWSRVEVEVEVMVEADV